MTNSVIFRSFVTDGLNKFRVIKKKLTMMFWNKSMGYNVIDSGKNRIITSLQYTVLEIQFQSLK